jgi:NADH dehydrogenase [ubiquinone] 1 alpha subcomplex assembly factor 7
MAKSFKISQIINKALFDKEFGYYRTRNPLGSNGDFITSPEISQIFGEVIAGYLLQFFADNRNKFSLVEMGAGRGFLFRDILQTIFNLSKKGNSLAINFLDNASFHIIEINPVLQKIQRQNLDKFFGHFPIIWSENFNDFLTKNYQINSKLFFISNELLDCFAIDQFVKTDIGWCERLVAVDDANLLSNPRYVLANFDSEVNQFIIDKISPIASSKARIGAVFEYSASLEKFYIELCKVIKSNGGIVLNCDYGYCGYDFANTLQAVKNHQKISFLQAFKNADITAQVDFFALDKISQSFNLNSLIITQRQFLLDLGGLERMKILCKKNPIQATKIAKDFERLTSLVEMGELFKFHIIWQ